MALYVFLILTVSSYVGHTKIESGLKAGFFIAVLVLTALIALNSL